MILYNSVDEINLSQWQELIHRSATATFFQTRECFDFYNSLSFLKPFVFGVSENDTLVGILCGYVIADGNIMKRFFSRRAIVPGGVLLAPDVSEQAVKLLLGKAQKELARKAIYMELRNYNDYSSFRPAIESAGFEYRPHLNFHVATPNVETASKQLSSTKRRDVKLSRKEGADWVETKDINELKAFYEILENLYKTRIKTPLFPFEFFLKQAQHPNGKIFVIKKDEQIIGGSVCMVLPGRAVYEWFVCGLDGKFKNIFPSTLATWAGIEYAALNGCNRFDMMGAGKLDEGYGVREFKSKFGGELVEHGRFLFICNPLLYKLGRFIVDKLKSRK
ncbi:MAG: peptidoglycan bridge formation glycyltransferase FemA/FemB family protein [Paludibacteraceae bacterium]